jgi:inhibitor of cysteine peptidase
MFRAQIINLYKHRYFGAFIMLAAMGLCVPVPAQGTDLGVKLNTEFTIRLKSNPTTGYRWKAEFDKHYLKLTHDTYYKSDNKLLGSGGTQTFTFEPIKIGETAINFYYQREWEKEPAKAKHYRIRIKP